MKVHVAGPTLPTASAVCRILRERGHTVSHSEHIPPDADLYFFCGGHEAIKVLPHGLVILDLRGDTTFAAAPWMPYADLCLASNDQDRTALVDIHGCEPERIFLVADDDALGDLVDRAVRDALPPAYNERRDKTMTDHSAAMRSEDRLAPQMADLPARLDRIERRADIMLRGYQVRSRAPVIGPLIAWVRRNLTSHLREPYLDPTFERQVAVNRELVAALRGLSDRQADLERRLARFEEEQQHD